MKQKEKVQQLNKNAGFSLLELLIAVTILAIITIPMLHMFVTSARINGKSRITLRATVLAQDIVEGLKAYHIDEIQDQFNGVEDFEMLNTSVIAGDCNEIIPFSGDKHMDAFLSYGIYILLAYRQVGRVDSQLLSQPAVDGFSGKELLRLLDGISGCSLICEADPIFQGIGRGKLSRCSHRCSQDQCR